MSFQFKDEKLQLVQGQQSMALQDIVKGHSEAFYLYDLDGILERTKIYRDAFKCNIKIHYAMKANSHPILLKAMAQAGIGVDIVSQGELQLAQSNGFSNDKIIFSGVGKSKTELRRAIQDEIRHINVESLEELERIAQLAKELKKKTSVVIRVNPDVDAKTHPYISTGFRENKFGIDLSQLSQITEVFKKNNSSLEFSGLSLHIGSQIRNIEPFKESIEKILSVYKHLQQEGFALKSLNIGGGLGIRYDNPQKYSGEKSSAEDLKLMHQYADCVSQIFNDQKNNFVGEVLCEPGRFLTASFGVLLTEIEYVKVTPHKNFLIVNTGMHHLLRPALYQAYHSIEPLVLSAKSNGVLYDIVGPICESSDILGKDRVLPLQSSGQWLAIRDVGAYGRSMSSQYNSHALPTEIFYSGMKPAL